MGARGIDDRDAVVLLWLIGACTIGFISFCVWQCATSGSTEYTVTITSVDGLDPALDLGIDRPALSPVFDITVHINNTLYKVHKQCIGEDSSAAVSYANALLGKGTVPAFCAQALGVGGAAATAWTMNVQLPRLLRNRLAGELERGEAVVDVVVRSPGAGQCHRHGCNDKVLVCKAKIGGRSSPCFLRETISDTSANR
ncbi:hypothetical protein VPH35_038540 [Triticum aestivum]